MVADQPHSPAFGGFEPPNPLPRGRKDLSPEAVADHQRERVVAAVAAVLVEQGYGRLTVERVISAARISRTTFYNFFTNKEDAVLFAQEVLFEDFIRKLGEACKAQEAWPEKVGAAIGATLDYAWAQPEQMQLLASEFLAADPIFAERARDYHDQLAALLREGRQFCPKATSMPVWFEPAMIAGVRSLVVRGIASGDPEEFADLRSQLIQLTLIPYIGHAEAAAVAAGR